MEPNDHQCAEMAQQFLSRVQLTGQEVPAYNHVMRWLDSRLMPQVDSGEGQE